jgi:uncharacterized protein YeaO (DUF488 family)
MADHRAPSTARRKSMANTCSVRIKRAYAAPSRGDGRRVLVDRIWPRGISRNELKLDAWLKDVAPSDDLRRWFNHDPARWPQFVARYRAELAESPAKEALAELVRFAQQRTLTLVYGARDETHNNAVALNEIITRRLANDGTAND